MKDAFAPKERRWVFTLRKWLGLPHEAEAFPKSPHLQASASSFNLISLHRIILSIPLSSMSARGGRANSVPWSRLKPVSQDPLEAIGLPSKGDNRLLDHKAQERYYTKIVERYMTFCSNAGRGDELSRRLARLEISSQDGSASGTTTPADIGLDAAQKDLLTLMMAMRKLREGIVASNRVDEFSLQAYIFCIRLSILVKHMESYHPAILHLLNRMHVVLPLAATELQEFVGYLVLDLACRQNEFSEAYAVRHRYNLHDPKVDAVLRALAHDNYYLFWRVKRSVDGHKAKIMEFSEDEMKRQTLKCLGRGYLNIDLPALEQYTNSSWASLKKEYSVGWQLEGTKVVIRKPKGK
ncbi:hypothetical protein D0Z07_4033 [Hyphodiscus hymeniophilus]|uniref:CSN8/PSMD8/EIF3K domain-containing protein n=1 Tax=Hyphodiscus hymeniophilus TaxID=353542 RepID=A0A9P6VKW5_9HELO|nr:hypothetical protein D0Z07_4033 [Hyphodiscus hymeniophilus]